MFRNGEGYPDPTAGAALAHIAYEERLKRKQARYSRRSLTKKNPSNVCHMIWVDLHNEKHQWIKAWPKGTEDTTNMNTR